MTLSSGIIWMFLLALVRMSGIVALAPLFSSAMISPRVKVGIITAFAMFIAGTLPRGTAQFSAETALPIIAGEFFVGLLLASGFYAAIGAASVAGELMGLQMGLGAASLFDANSGNNGALLSNFWATAFTLLFIVCDGPHHILRVLGDSYGALPAGYAAQRLPSLDLMVAQSAKILMLGCRLAAPVVIPLLLLTVTIGMVSRVFPQMNVLSFSYGLSIVVGIMLLASTVAGIREAVWGCIQDADRFAIRMMESLAGA